MLPEILPRALPQSFRVTTKSFLFDDVPKTWDFFLPRLLPRETGGGGGSSSGCGHGPDSAGCATGGPCFGRFRDPSAEPSAILPREISPRNPQDRAIWHHIIVRKKKEKRNKTKQNKTKQNKTKQIKSNQIKSKQKAKQSKGKQTNGS